MADRESCLGRREEGDGRWRATGDDRLVGRLHELRPSVAPLAHLSAAPCSALSRLSPILVRVAMLVLVLAGRLSFSGR